jgi:PAS domain S-box-containing protein
MLGEFVARTGTRVLGQFNRSRFRPEIIHGVLRTHPLVVIGTHVVDNPFYEPGALVVKRGQATERRRVEWMLTQLQDKIRRGMATADLEHWALSGASPSDLMRAATHLIALELKANLAESFELQPPDNKLRLVADVGWRVPPMDGPQIRENPAKLFGNFLKLGQPLIVADWSGETRFKRPAMFGAEEISSSAVVAISTPRDEHLYGLLGVHFKEPRTFSMDEISFLDKVAVALAYAMSRARSEEQFRTLVEHVPDIIGRFDPELRLVYANPALETIAEAPAESLRGKTMREVGLPESLEVAWELVLRRAWQSAREETIEFTLESRHGERYFQGRIVPERLPSGGVQSLMLIARDLTEQRKAESERAKLYEEVLAQQARLQELVSRLIEDHQHEVQRLGHAIRAEQLTERERQILPLLAAGWTNREIAAELGMSVGTVKNHVARILEKLDVSDRTQAAVRAVELGMTKTTT